MLIQFSRPYASQPQQFCHSLYTDAPFMNIIMYYTIWICFSLRFSLPRFLHAKSRKCHCLSSSPSSSLTALLTYLSFCQIVLWWINNKSSLSSWLLIHTQSQSDGVSTDTDDWAPQTSECSIHSFYYSSISVDEKLISSFLSIISFFYLIFFSTSSDVGDVAHANSNRYLIAAY